VEATAIRQLLTATPAIRTNRLVRIDPDWANRPGPRIVEALEQFAQAIHPESP
jgi:ABC-type Fe3+-hydroxamate transport system substrate-binding protein